MSFCQTFIITIIEMVSSPSTFSFYVDKRNEAEKGNPEAQYELGAWYERGLHGISQDYKEAVYWYQQAANQNHKSTQNNLGMMYRRGLGVEQSNDKAVEWYKKAIANGCEAAKHNLNICLSPTNNMI